MAAIGEKKALDFLLMEGARCQSAMAVAREAHYRDLKAELGTSTIKIQRTAKLPFQRSLTDQSTLRKCHARALAAQSVNCDSEEQLQMGFLLRGLPSNYTPLALVLVLALVHALALVLVRFDPSHARGLCLLIPRGGVFQSPFQSPHSAG